ncbi:zona pellucida sperm-binding protein 4-like [Zootoca vivipara]|uniref:zona pellucida sperm-binding protein 4-like n=1 Tax=Zootoca vivipara TaxID=8524 RepID=UPI0015915E9F|nr:zona pellucida sperm-binding protein 4-like [Zootoca vivipara]
MCHKVQNDPKGNPHLLKNDSTCGTSAFPNPDGSVVVRVAFDGCYTRAQDSRYRTTVHIEGLAVDGRMTSYKEELSCPEPLLAALTAGPTVQSIAPPVALMFLLDLLATVLLAQGPWGALAFAPKMGYMDKWGTLADRQVLDWAKSPSLLPALDTPSASHCSSVPAPDRLPCGPRQVQQAECVGLGCCYNPTEWRVPCYYANKVTAHCTPDGHFSIVLSRNVTSPPLRLDSVRLASGQGERCAPASRNNGFVFFQFPLSACGTTFKESGSRHVYENELVADRQVLASPSGSITRDSNFRLTVRCSYSAEDSLPVSIQIATPPAPAGVAEQGPLTLEMRLARDAKYSSYYSGPDYPVVKVLRAPVHVEVRLLARRDPALVLVLHDCWATPSTNPLQKPQWLLLQDGCPYKGDNYRTRVVPIREDSGLPFPTHYQRFVVSTFTFVEGASQQILSGQVYFHCSVSACAPSALESCNISCNTNPPGRSRRASSGEHRSPEKWLTLVTSDGPVDFFHKDANMVIHEASPKSLYPSALMQWDNILFLVAGLVAVLTVGMFSVIALKKHQAAQGGQNLPYA